MDKQGEITSPENGSISEMTNLEVNGPAKRDVWGKKIEFILTCISYAIGLGNVWRFPYLYYKYGRAAFIIPYTTMLLFIGLPVFFLELSFGQFASLGPISVWRISPLFKGVGYAMLASSWIVSIYYNVIVAQCILFFGWSFISPLPWSNCKNKWNTNKCLDKLSNTTNNIQGENLISPSNEFYRKEILNISNGLDELGIPSWKLVIGLLCAWIITCVVLSKGIKSLGKFSYFIAIFPYIILTALLVQILIQPGSWEFVKVYFTADFNQIFNVEAWVEAATQIFYSLGCCYGCLITMSSYNKFKNNCCRDAIIVAVINCLTSLFATLVVISTIGYIQSKDGIRMQNAEQPEKSGLVFIVYPEALEIMPGSNVWSALFFLMLITIGMGSVFPMVETVTSGIQDELSRYGIMKSWLSQTIFRIVLCSVNFLLGVAFTCSGGSYLLDFVNDAIAGYPLLIICLVELLVIFYGYGYRQFIHDIELMLNERISWYWRINWIAITPLTAFILLIFKFVKDCMRGYGNRKEPRWALALEVMISIYPVVFIGILFLYKFCREGGCILCRELLKPVEKWGPAADEHRAEFLSAIRDRNQAKSSDYVDNASVSASNFLASLGPSDALVASTSSIKLALGGSMISNLALGDENAGEKRFFQSKLMVAEAFSLAHAKNIAKRATGDGGCNSLQLEAYKKPVAENTNDQDIVNDFSKNTDDVMLAGPDSNVPVVKDE